MQIYGNVSRILPVFVPKLQQNAIGCNSVRGTLRGIRGTLRGTKKRGGVPLFFDWIRSCFISRFAHVFDQIPGLTVQKFAELCKTSIRNDLPVSDLLHLPFPDDFVSSNAVTCKSPFLQGFYNINLIPQWHFPFLLTNGEYNISLPAHCTNIISQTYTQIKCLNTQNIHPNFVYIAH